MWNSFTDDYRKALWEQWRKLIIGPIAAVIFSYEYITGNVIGMPQIPILGRVLIGISTLIITQILAYRSVWLKMRAELEKNWINKYEIENGGLPILPEYLVELFPNYSSGPVSKGMTPITPSGQKWNSLLPSQQKEWRQVVEWLGKDPEDLLIQMRQMQPKTPLGIEKRRWKPFKQH